MGKGKIDKSAFYYKRNVKVLVVLAIFSALYTSVFIICAVQFGIIILGVFGALSAVGFVVFIRLAVLSKRAKCSLCGGEIEPRDAHGFSGRAYCRDCIGRVVRVADNAEQALGALYASGFAPTRVFTVTSLVGREIPAELQSERNVFRIYIDDAGERSCITIANGGREYLLDVFDKKDVCRATASSLAETRLREETRMNAGCILAGFLLGGIILGLIALAVRETIHVPYTVNHYVVDIYTDGYDAPVCVECGSAEEAGSLCAALERRVPPRADAGELPSGGNKVIYNRSDETDR